MNPIALALMGGTSLMSLIGGMDANRVAKENLGFQQKQAADELRFAKAGHTDAFGNRTTFDDQLNEWLTQLTPQQQNLIKAGEREQLLGLTKDAAQNRSIREAQGVRGQQAGEDYNTLRSDYFNKTPPSEASIMDQITNLITQARGTGDRATAKLVGQQGLRQHGNLPVINTGDPTGQRYAGDQLAQTLLQARQSAAGEKSSRDQAHTSKYLPALRQFEETAGRGGNAQFHMSNTPEMIAKQREGLDKNVLDAFKQGSTGVQAGSNLAAHTEGAKFPSYANAISLFAAGNKSGTGTTSKGDAFYGGSPKTNPLINPSTYGNVHPQPNDLFPGYGTGTTNYGSASGGITPTRVTVNPNNPWAGGDTNFDDWWKNTQNLSFNPFG